MDDKKKEINMMEMLKAGVHFGHKKSKRHPKMGKYIYTLKNGISIIDLNKTRINLEAAIEFVKEISLKEGKILFVGTKKQAKEPVRKAAERCDMPYVVERWLGGTFTNFNKITESSVRLEKIMEQREESEFKNKYTKKERLEIDREIKRLEKKFWGIRKMKHLPNAVFTASAEESTVIAEATAKDIPIISMVDTNMNPDIVDYPIPSNDDSIKAVELIVNAIADAIIEGKKRNRL